MNFMKLLFGNYSKRELKKIDPIVNKAVALQEEYGKLTEKELQDITDILLRLR